uniref:Sodium-coupled monocarboxylate transporter 1 n=1 Tax=Ciona savignyi TaxID=51511 RepID=H2YDW6_CIOSA
MLVFAMGIGVFYAVRDRSKKNIQNYYFGGRQISPIPLGLSMSASFISAITIIGFPTETYLFGTIFWYCFSSVFPTMISTCYYIPLIHRLKLTSIFMYLEWRFHRSLRIIASMLSIVTMIFYMANTIYIPGLALNAVSPLSLEWTIILTSMVCVFYTALGGMKAVVWTDAVQSLIMLSGSLGALIKATYLVGGMDNVWDALDQSGRLNAFEMNPDPRIRYSFWTVWFGVAVTWSGALCINQVMSQRYLSCSSVKNARIAAMVAVFPNIIFVLISVMTGCVMYAYYQHCDPVLNGVVKKPDQLLPYMVVEIFKDVPGMAGLFVSAAFSGTLSKKVFVFSTVSSGISSLAALMLEDFILPRKPDLGEVAKLTISKIIVVAFGGLVMCMAMLVNYIGATVIQFGFTVAGTLMGPLLGIYTLGLFFPWATWKGACIGQIVGTLFTSWLAVGGLVYPSPPSTVHLMPRSIDQCPVQDVTNFTTSGYFMRTFPEVSTLPEVESNLLYSDGSLQNTLYAISYLHYGPISLFVTLLVGLLASFITGANKPADANPLLFVPLVGSDIFPKKVLKFFRLGVPEIKVDDDNSEFLQPQDKPVVKPTKLITDNETVL